MSDRRDKGIIESENRIRTVVRKGKIMKKALKVVGVVAVAGAGLYACNYYKQYRKFKKMEERMEKLPLHKLQEAVKERRSNPDTVVVEVSKRAGLWQKLIACLHVLTA